MKKKLLLPLIFIVVISNLYSQTEVNNTTAVPYSENEFPQWLKDVRDTEIITIGSLPFVMLGVSLTYSLIDVISHDFDMSYFSNPFSIPISSPTTVPIARHSTSNAANITIDSR